MRWQYMLAILISLASPLLVSSTSASVDDLCFRETGRCISGRFRQYWEQNGGLAVFGYPITGVSSTFNRDTQQFHMTQWFERARFEWHPEVAPPYDVLLGRLGDDRLQQRGIKWSERTREAGGAPGCLWFEQTQLNVCDQAPGLGFLSYWQAHGLADPALDSYGQSLALFGLPLTSAQMERNGSGEVVLTQWFERARFEWHPDQPDQYKVLLGLLGSEQAATGPIEMCGIENFAWTIQGALARSAQPPPWAWACLREHGFTTIMQQNTDADTSEQHLIRALGMTYLGDYGLLDQTAIAPEMLEAMLHDVVARLQRGERILVHDAGGRGRLGMWEAAFLMWDGWSSQAAIERYLALGWKIDCNKGGNGQMQAINEVAVALGQPASYPSHDRYGTPWQDCPRPDYMHGWDYRRIRWPDGGGQGWSQTGMVPGQSR